MKSGYWINYRTGKTVPINEHEEHIRDPKNAKALGVPPGIIKNFAKFEPVKDRVKFLTYVLEHSPLMRVRGHGTFVSFEYASRDRKDPIESIWLWGKQFAGPFTLIDIHNLKTNENTAIRWQDFLSVVEKDGYEGIMRVAKHNRRLARQMVRVAREIAEVLGDDGV